MLYKTDQGEQSLNFICEDKKDYDTWLSGLKVSYYLLKILTLMTRTPSFEPLDHMHISYRKIGPKIAASLSTSQTKIVGTLPVVYSFISQF